ncbi:MAG: D-glycero-beta-D-manno-heptose 1-phosphate adenylyltransferase [Candidatus Eiseniibacteriota bacterium]|nr:MAG: D-glycero-beta-D-manno-heptose 1-phosphate adenylyltransferase [Candidatus Eisenbacteria bacterium]
MGRIVDRTEVAGLRQYARESGLKVVFTNGCFDILHLGHVHYLSRARQLGDVLFVGLNSDGSMRKLKGVKRPIVPQADRAGVLCALSCVDYVCIFDEETPDALIREVQPGVLVKGGDYKADDIVGASFVRELGGEVVVIDALEGRSTQSLIDTIVRRFGSGA